MNFVDNITRYEIVEVVQCDHCNMEFVLYFVFRRGEDEEEHVTLMSQIDDNPLYCPCCGKYTNDKYNLEGVNHDA